MAGNANIVVDLSNYKDKIGSRVPEGLYRVVVEETEVDTSSAGNQMINLYMRVVGGEQDGATLVDRLVLTEKSLFRVVGFMQALGLPTPKKRLQVNIASWVGKALLVDVADGEPYNGRVKSEVRGYEKAPRPAAVEVLDLEVDEAASESEPVTASTESDSEPKDTATVGAAEVIDLDDLEL